MYNANPLAEITFLRSGCAGKDREPQSFGVLFLTSSFCCLHLFLLIFNPTVSTVSATFLTRYCPHSTNTLTLYKVVSFMSRFTDLLELHSLLLQRRLKVIISHQILAPRAVVKTETNIIIDQKLCDAPVSIQESTIASSLLAPQLVTPATTVDFSSSGYEQCVSTTRYKPMHQFNWDHIQSIACSSRHSATDC